VLDAAAARCSLPDSLPMKRLLLISVSLLCGSFQMSLGVVQASETVDFARDIQPLLAERCLLCHGPDAAESGLRLDAAQYAHGLLSSAAKAIVPGDPQSSELMRRIAASDDQRMPPEGEPLTSQQIEMFRSWIASGAKYERHWAYQPVELPVVPATSQPQWCANPIDHFVLAQLDSLNLAPSPQADRITLIKRLYYDLIGLPPTIEDVDAFVNATDPQAYEQLVDSLLKSTHFGERWGRHWLDMARYADSDGYEKDNPRPNAWRYRDWVIDAVNRDLPLDQFTIEQLAGDLLLAASPTQMLATAFHRQTLTNTEGGTDQEEFRVEATFDRTETTAAVWMGLTLTCARCHSHKYDSISHQEYYQLFSLFNNSGEGEIEVPRSDRELELYQAKRATHDAAVQAIESQYQLQLQALQPEIEAWEAEIDRALTAAEPLAFHPLDQPIAATASGAEIDHQPDGSFLISGEVADKDQYTITIKSPSVPITGIRLEALSDTTLNKNGPGRAPNGNFVLTTLAAMLGNDSDFSQSLPIHFVSAEADFSQAKFDPQSTLTSDPKTGWAVAPQIGKPHTITAYTSEPIQTQDQPWLKIVVDHQYGGMHTLGRFRVTLVSGSDPLKSLPMEVAAALRTKADKRTAEQRRAIADQVAAKVPAAADLAKRLAELKKQTPPSAMMKAAVIKPVSRKTRRLQRGDFLQPDEEVSSGALRVIEEVHPLSSRRADQSPDRLDLAHWLMDPNHPLTPRVMANHVWARLFGRGIVATVNDFGVRGERPTHPELLDWLGWSLSREFGWSRKRLIKTMVMSSAYRQSSQHRPDLVEIDPTNRYLARQNRFRVEAEIVRDLVLASSGLLDRSIGGPSVFPPLPPGVAELSYANNFKWKTSDGGDRYRRGMYTFFKRTSPHPTLITFDCPDSNTALLRRETSNTPLQALALLNNPVFSEAAIALAGRVLLSDSVDLAKTARATDLSEKGAGSDAVRMAHAFRLCLTRSPSSTELARLSELLSDARRYYEQNPDEVPKLLGETQSVTQSPQEHAAWSATLRVLINLDEFIVRD